MARPLRLEFPGAHYHITARGNERKEIYREQEDYILFLKTLSQAAEEKGWLLHAYCLMPNHYHLLLETREANLSKGMRQLNGIYTQRFNRKYKRSGHLFQGRYKAILVEKETYFLELCRYIALNPVRAKIVDKPEKWPYSSYCAAAGLNSSSFLYTDYVLSQFDGAKKKAQLAYRDFVAEGIGKPSPWASLVGQIYLGSENFLSELEKNLKEKDICEEIPVSQRYPVRPAMDKILEQAAKVYGIDAADLCKPRANRAARDIAIYLCRQLGGYDLKTIARQFKMSYTRVSQIVGKVSAGAKSDKDLQELLRSLESLGSDR
ncbi:MAG: transposase [Actinomycetota bacterium]|nr:transposase [Actinomycetota bacterium]